MFKTIANAWKTVDLRKKILFTVLIVLLYRVGTAIPVPFLNAQVLSSSLLSSQGSLFQYLNILSGGAMSQATLFALGVSPYITASIVIQLLTIAIPYLERISKEGEEGQKKLNQLTRIATVVLGLVTSFGYYKLLENNNAITNKGVFPAFVIILSYCAGSSLVMWLAEKINENGIGNGISIILFANIVSRLPSMIHNLWSAYLTSGNAGKIILGIGVIIVSLAATALIVFITDSERRLPIQYAKKVVGRKMYGGQSSTLPLKVNMTGVMPMIFANSIVSIPATIQMFVNPKQGSFWAGFFNLFGTDGWLYAALTAILIVAFAYFYVTKSFNPIEVPNNIKKKRGFIPGIRPGKPTSDYITKVLSRITLIGALFLVVIAVVPLVANIISGAKLSSLAFTGSSIIIVVGVVLETAREIESQMTMRHYKGFLE